MKEGKWRARVFLYSGGRGDHKYSLVTRRSGKKKERKKSNGREEERQTPGSLAEGERETVTVRVVVYRWYVVVRYW